MSEILTATILVGVIVLAVWLFLTPTPQERRTQEVLDELVEDHPDGGSGTPGE